MSAPLPLTSVKNPRVLAALELTAKHKVRTETGLFAVEGAREIGRALASGFVLVELFYYEAALSPAASEITLAAARQPGVARYTVTQPVFAKLAVREGSDGLLAVFKQRLLTLAGLQLPPVPLILAVQGIEKPGNLGALLRSADGAGADAVVLLDKSLDLYNPHVLRTSLGTAFRVPVVAASSDEFRVYARERGLKVHAAALTERAVAHYAADFRGPAVILLGEEAQGLSADWLESAAQCVKIPMRGIADSLNVSTAGAVLLYEAVRQRASA